MLKAPTPPRETVSFYVLPPKQAIPPADSTPVIVTHSLNLVPVPGTQEVLSQCLPNSQLMERQEVGTP